MMKNQIKVFLAAFKIWSIPLSALLFICLCSNTAYAQVKSITGTVTDEIGDPLPGASIVEKGTKNGVTSDFDGNYSISINQGATLSISFIGYKTKEIVITNQTTLDVNLDPDFNQLDEAVVIGYGSVRRKDLTGSVASVKMDQLTEAPVANFDQALAGRVTGVQVSANSGEPGEGLKITIRGGNSINGANGPLYVLDGFIMDTDFNTSIIDPSDIESIDVLKDASATAIYGARGANGVILITTRQSKLGKTLISYETRLDISNVANTLDVLDSYEFIKLSNELSPSNTSRSFFQDVDGNVVGGVDDYKDEPTSNWQDEAFRTAYATTHKFRISHGSEKTKFNASINYLDQEGTLIETGFNKINGRLNLKHNVNDKFDITADIIYSNSEQLGLNTKGTATYSFLRGLISYQPVINKFIDYGDSSPLDGIVDSFYDDSIVNWHPILSLENEYRKREEDQFISNIALRYKIKPYLTLDVRGSYNKKFRQNGTFNNSKTVYGRLINPINGINGGMDYTTWTTLSNINTLTFNKKLGKDHRLNAMVGFSVNVKEVGRNITRAIQIPEYAEGQGVNALDEGLLSTTQDFAGSYKERIQSLLARVNYTYKDRYIITSSIRRDGSSKFAPDHNIGYMPSIGLAWKMEEEDFIQNVDWISQLKLRVGYGRTGNDRIPAEARFDLYTSDGASYFIGGNEVLGQRPTSTGANPLVQWEVTSQYNAGLDVGLYNGRINFGVEVYQKETEDLLLKSDRPQSTGISSLWENSGTVRNQGLEFSLSTVNVTTKDFTWTTDFNISFNQNEVVSLPEGKPIFGNPNYFWRFASNQFIVEEGQPLGNMFGYVNEGVYQPADFDNYDPDATSHTLSAGQPSYKNGHQPGDEKYKDLDGNGTITSADKTVIGNGLAKHFGGFGNNFEYKGFQLSAFFQWSYGNDIMNANRLVFEEMRIPNNNQYATVLDRWTPENQNTDLYRAGGRGFEDLSSRVIEDGSYIRLKTINFSYNFSGEVLDKLNLNSLKLYAAAQNLFTWTDYSGFDPEVSVRSSAIMPGVDYSAYPLNKTVSFGLNVTF